MEWQALHKLAEIGPQVAIVAIFIWYIWQRNGKQERAMQRVADSLYNLERSQQVHTRVLINVARKHGNNTDADNLMEGTM